MKAILRGIISYHDGVSCWWKPVGLGWGSERGKQTYRALSVNVKLYLLQRRLGFHRRCQRSPTDHTPRHIFEQTSRPCVHVEKENHMHGKHLRRRTEGEEDARGRPALRAASDDCRMRFTVDLLWGHCMHATVERPSTVHTKPRQSKRPTRLTTKDNDFSPLSWPTYAGLRAPPLRPQDCREKAAFRSSFHVLLLRGSTNAAPKIGAQHCPDRA